jgi:coproporphyrinogen III oxidase
VVKDDVSGAFGAAAALVEEIQQRVCDVVTGLERGASFAIDDWSAAGDDGAVKGRGSTRVIAGGSVIEKGGVNTSIVSGNRLPSSLVTQRPELAACGFVAAGVSVVIHPMNPYAPTAHGNYRYFEARTAEGETAAWWFGGGADLTPYYPVLDDVRHFHAAQRDACDRHDPAYYQAFKAWCDTYFYIKHRNEARGVGGIFYDYLDEHGFGESASRTTFDRRSSFDRLLAFSRDAAGAFVDGYFPLVARHAGDTYGERERQFQLLRRGRYAEFNLVYDRGTAFGLQSGGRVESILMSLPPVVRWAYDERPEPGSRESALAPYLVPRDWFAPDPFAT